MHISAAGVNYSKTAVTFRRTEVICAKQEVILWYVQTPRLQDGSPLILMKLLTERIC